MPKRLPDGRIKRTARLAARRRVTEQQIDDALPAVQRDVAPAVERPVVTETRPAPRPMPLRGTALRAEARGVRSPINTDYRYVISDLKRIGVLAAAAFAVLGGLALVIR